MLGLGFNLEFGLGLEIGFCFVSGLGLLLGLGFLRVNVRFSLVLGFVFWVSLYLGLGLWLKSVFRVRLRTRVTVRIG